MTAAPAVITSRDNPLLKELRKLSQDGAHYRKTGRVWIEGEHLCQAFADKGLEAELLLISDQNPPLAGRKIARSATKTIVVADALLREISALDSPAKMGAVMRLPSQPTFQASAPTVILDRLQDPGNVGSILRSSAAFGFTQIIALKGTVALWSPKVLRAGMGAHFSLQLIEAASLDDVATLQRPLAATSSHQGYFLHDLLQNKEQSEQISSQQDPKNASKMASRPPISQAPALSSVNWVMGHEGQGVQAALEALAQLAVRIAQPGGEESLNVAAAAAIVLAASSMAQLMNQS